MTRAAEATVTVRSADGEVVEVEPDGGVLVLSDDGLQAPLVVACADGDEGWWAACRGRLQDIADGM